MSDVYRPSKAHMALGSDFFDEVIPAVFPQTTLRFRNQAWAERVGLGDMSEQDWIAHFAKFESLAGSLEHPLALRYHGHQFGAYNPDLGDGRGFLFGQLFDPRDDRLLDLGTKGSGTTPWSRGGDGRLTLKGGIREILASELLEAFGVNTSKSFSLVETGEALERGDEPSPTRSSVLVRLSHSHIRIGTFQRLAFLEDTENLQKLTDYAIAHYYRHLDDQGSDERVAGFLGAVVDAVAQTGAQMIAAGFVHGVLNTDNINITGECFDYGPWRFLPHYDPLFTAAYFDTAGRYAFGRQPDALAWSLTRLAECLVPISTVELLEPQLNRFWPHFQTALGQAVLNRLGLLPRDPEADHSFVSAFFAFMGAVKPAYEQVFFDLFGGLDNNTRMSASPQAGLYRSDDFADLGNALSHYERNPQAALHDPYFTSEAPCTMLIEQVEALWSPIAERDDWSLFESTLKQIRAMARANAHLHKSDAKSP
ncbi:protein adenylyltransferase SelO [Pelagibacterium lentulum]|uniref:Protein nucleotidyltransferase YdiU n=1 Tax=Pelagibacterium lentulum TaxID=2029865 RepID=A0A916R815_9HYPH|nr:YdiU family protein [Pelagibacterium lentulum]GGA36995.1 UPF0061 protein [Pelagibacterium lentulum]